MATACGALAAAGVSQTSGAVEGRLVSAADSVGSSHDLKLGLELKLKDGWKTYWRSPGDAGLPPTIDWAGSTNLDKATIAYPKPERFQLFGLQTFGYSKHIVLPIHGKLASSSTATELKARAEILVCEQVCVPHTLDLSLSLPAGAGEPGSEAQLINQFEAAVPQDATVTGLLVTKVVALEQGADQAVEITATSRDGFTAATDVIAEFEPPVAFKAPISTLSGDGKTATLRLPLAQELPPGATLAGRSATLTLIDGPTATEMRTTIAAAASRDITAQMTALAGIIGLALIGGFVLNLMPCVLPVLSIKLMAVAGHSAAPTARVRASFLATAAGTVTAMLAIAVALIGLKSAGLAVGWGIQFQQPVFIVAMALVLTLFAANFWGLFEVALPSRVSNVVGSIGDEGSLLGNFALGAFATFLATPCSAPFVGTAVGFALAQGPVDILLIFFALGLGLASPYLAVAAWPYLAKTLPRPGEWMVTLRRLLGLALVGTAFWLLTVLASQSGPSTAIAAGVLLATLVGLFAVGRHFDARRNLNAVAATALAMVIVALPFVAGSTKASRTAAIDDRLPWSAFDAVRIRGLVAEGKTVFVDVTADWCITCQANKKLVILQPDIRDRIAGETTPMRADWTRPDPAITSFLASFGRYGIPFNVVFGPGKPAGVVLPELLTTEAIERAIAEASGGSKQSVSVDTTDVAN